MEQHEGQSSEQLGPIDVLSRNEPLHHCMEHIEKSRIALNHATVNVGSRTVNKSKYKGRSHKCTAASQRIKQKMSQTCAYEKANFVGSNLIHQMHLFILISTLDYMQSMTSATK